MKRTLATIWLAWMLALSPKTQAEITPKTEETKKDLIEVVSQWHTSLENDDKTISYEATQELLNNQKLMEAIMSNEKIQGISQEYWQDVVEKSVSAILSNKKISNIIENLSKDENIQQSLEEWNDLDITEETREFFSLKLSKRWEPTTIMDVIVTISILAMFGATNLGIWTIGSFLSWDFLLNYTIKRKDWRVCICKRELTDLEKKQYEWNGHFWVLKTDEWNKKYPETL